jgi:dTDP-4-dehydrorhamnose reductase
MRILLFGKNGQLGWELHRSLQPLGEVFALDRGQADFSKPESLRNIVSEIRPDVIVNAVAYTAVDKAENEESQALTVNAESPEVLAEEALKSNALLVHFSTDYVFDGSKDRPYVETDATGPVNAYGRTKLAGEDSIKSSGCDYLIFRASWVYASRGNNFLLTILNSAKQRNELGVVSDQEGSPTSARLLADTTSLCVSQSMIERKEGKFLPGIYHVAASGRASWFVFANEIMLAAGDELDVQFKSKIINAIPTAAYPTVAKRPVNSQLKTDKIQNRFKVVMPDWKNTLRLCIKEVGLYY